MVESGELALPFLERLAMAVLRRTPAHAPVAGEDDPIHVLNEAERRELHRIEQRAVARAAVAGALSGAASASAAIWAALRFLGPGGLAHSTTDHALYWTVVLAATVVASIFEIGFLYWDALRSVHSMATAAGLRFSESQTSEQREVALALARAALELPNPQGRVFGVNPHRESLRWVVAVASLLYKAKIALTTFLIKLVLRTFLGHFMGRAVLELVTIPVTAAWNAVVCFMVAREARLRVMGPSAAVELVGYALQGGLPSAEGRRAAFRSVASAVVRTGDLHPNLHALLRVLVEKLGPVDFDDVDDPTRFLDELRAFSVAEQRLALRLLIIAAVIDGRLTRNERALVAEAFRACGRTLPLERVERLRSAFYGGAGVDFELVQKLVE
ncbi:MAG TPA: hypothetical protein VFV94_03965 [Polyangiaceae bacterium]|nr:hypothetical protein [Polyangiaceae bacterium]